MKKNLLFVIDSFISREYLSWRYWQNLIRTMETRIANITVKPEGPVLRYINKPGIAFSFDDSYRIHHWYNYGRVLFGHYDVKVTFNINAFHHFEQQREHTQEEIDMLLELQSAGHEIANHGFRHQKAVTFSNELGLRTWVEEEIINLVNWMENQAHSITNEKFKKPVTFAFPHFNYNQHSVMELIPKYFKVVRGHLDEDNFTPFNHTGLAPSICLDTYYTCNLSSIKKMLKMAKKIGKNLIFTCHSILPDDVNWNDFGWGSDSLKSGTWRISPKIIQMIINEARNNDMEFYTTSELAGIATFIDRNFENFVRQHIAKSSDDWILIADLISIKKLDLTNKQISNIDGIQYFLSLETLNLSNNNITDFRLIEKLPQLRSVDITNNPNTENFY